MSRQRRLICVYQHAPTPGAPGIYRHRLLLSELVRRGWHVDLVSTPVNYMTGETPERYRGRAYVREEIDGIVHHWVYAPSGIHESKIRRVLNYATFATAATLRGIALPRPDVILVSSPPLTVGTVGPLLAARFRRPWLLEVRDPGPSRPRRSAGCRSSRRSTGGSHASHGGSRRRRRLSSCRAAACSGRSRVTARGRCA